MKDKGPSYLHDEIIIFFGQEWGFINLFCGLDFFSVVWENVWMWLVLDFGEFMLEYLESLGDVSWYGQVYFTLVIITVLCHSTIYGALVLFVQVMVEFIMFIYH